MKKLLLLTRRDLAWVLSKARNRFLIWISILVLLLIKFSCSFFHDEKGIEMILEKLIGGEIIEVLKESKFAFPLQWFVYMIAPSIILFDFIRCDLAEQGHYIFTKISRRTLYWLSKCLLIVGVTFIIVSFHFAAIFMVFGFLKGVMVINWLVFFKMFLFIWIGLILTSILFATLSLFFKEIVSFVGTLVFLGIGLLNPNFWVPANHLMWRRQTADTIFSQDLTVSFLYSFVMTGILLVIGIIRIKKMDILGNEKEN